MSQRVIQWNIKPPGSDAADDEQPQPSLCPVCGKEFWKKHGRRKVCDACFKLSQYERDKLRGKRSAKTKQCKICLQKFTPNKKHRVICADCSRIHVPSKNAPGDGGYQIGLNNEQSVFSFDTEIAVISAIERVDDFCRYDEQVGVETQKDLDAIFSEIDHNGFAMASSATHTAELPPFAIAIIKLDNAIEHAKPKEVFDRRLKEYRDQTRVSINQWMKLD